MFDAEDRTQEIVNGIAVRSKPVDRKEIQGKPKPLLMPYCCLVAYSKVSDYGNTKYGNRDSWMHSSGQEGIERYLNAATRHIYGYAQGEERDGESDLPHIYQALWNICAAVWHFDRLNAGTEQGLK